MATSIQGTGAVTNDGRIEAGQLPGGIAELDLSGDPPLLFVNQNDEPLVENPAEALAPPLVVPAEMFHRGFDLALATACLMFLWPLMLATAVFVWLSGPGPIIFRHVRIGRDGMPFVCFKFRTMNKQAEELLTELLGTCGTLRHEWQSNQKIRRDPRVTRVGQWLRRYSIDELPQLFNVLRGDMSMVGPRPIVEAEIDRYGANFADYCRVKPGITGLWQISGRNCLSYERRVELDSLYARTRSLGGDLAIVIRTVPVVLKGSGC